MIEDVPLAMIFNIDKSGYSAWANAYEVTVLVPDSYLRSSITIPVDCPTKRATVVGGIASDESTIKQIVIGERLTMEIDIRCVGRATQTRILQRICFVTMNQCLY
jgi:hypothetical protein